MVVSGTTLIFGAALLLVSVTANSQNLTDYNFNSEIGKERVTLVMFYVPWCHHCQHLLPFYERAADTIRSDNSHKRLVKVNCQTGGTKTCHRFKVHGYPTLKLFKHGSYVQDYRGPRTTQGIVQFVRRISP